MSSITVESAENDDQQPESGQMIANNYDLTTQILLRLPPDSVSNLKLTSKLWLSISSDPTFIKNHVLRHPQALSGLFLHYAARPRTLSHDCVAAASRQFVAAQNSLGLNILQSCNGLLLCSSSDTDYYVCNPTTLQRKHVPLPKGVYNRGDFGVNLAFDPKMSTFYKVVCVRKLYGQQARYQVEVYSSETRQWKTVGEPFIEHDVLDFRHGVFCKGASHWLKTTSVCLYFDVDQEFMKSTPQPPSGKQCPSYSHDFFGQANDHLYFVVRRHLPNFTLLQMKEDYSDWFVKCAINFNALAKDFPIMARNFERTPRFLPHYECNVLCVVGSEECSDDTDQAGVELVLSMPGKIVRFNPVTNASREFGDLVLRPYSKSIWYKDFLVHEYIQTICPV